MDELEVDAAKAAAPPPAPRTLSAPAPAPVASAPAAPARSDDFSLEDQLMAELGGDLATQPAPRRQPAPAPRQAVEPAFGPDEIPAASPVGAGRGGAILATRAQQGRRSQDTDFDRLADELEASFSEEPEIDDYYESDADTGLDEAYPEVEEDYYEEEYAPEPPAPRAVERPAERPVAREPARQAAAAPAQPVRPQPVRSDPEPAARFNRPQVESRAAAPNAAAPSAVAKRVYDAPPPSMAEIDDFGAAFEEQFRRMREPANAAPAQPAARQPAPAPLKASAAPQVAPVRAPEPVQPPSPVSERNLEDKFAAAFAEELEIGADDMDPAEDGYGEEYADDAYAHGPYAEAPYAEEPYEDELVDDEQDWEWEEEADERGQQGVAGRGGQPYRAAARRSDPYAEDAYDGDPYEGEPYDDADYDEQRYDADGYYDEAQYQQEPLRADEAVFEAAHRNSQRKGPHRGLLLAGGALAVALLLGGAALAFSYFIGSDSSSGPVVINADPDPVKVRPDNAGGAEIANQDTAVYDRVSGGPAGSPTQETLINNAEKPVDVASLAETSSADVADSGTRGQGVQTETGDIKAEQRLQAGELRPSSIDSVLAPRRVATLAVKPDGSIVQPAETAEPAPARSIAPAVAETPAAATPAASEAEVAPARVAEREPLKPLEGAVRTGRVARPVPRPTDVPESAGSSQLSNLFATDAAEPASAPASGEWAVQLASQRSQEDAEATFQNLKRRFPGVLGNQQMSVQRADVEGKGVFFRVRVTAATREEANTICQNLRTAGGSCFVTR